MNSENFKILSPGARVDIYNVTKSLAKEKDTKFKSITNSIWNNILCKLDMTRGSAKKIKFAIRQ